jgi:hypothetical protein
MQKHAFIISERICHSIIATERQIRRPEKRQSGIRKLNYCTLAVGESMVSRTKQNWVHIIDENEQPLDPNLAPVSNTGCPIHEYMTTRPFKKGCFYTEGILSQLRQDFQNFIREGVMRVWAEPAPPGPHNTMSDLVLYTAFVKLNGHNKHVCMYFDFHRSRICVEGFVFKVLTVHIPRKWTLMGSHHCQNWEPIHHHSALRKPRANSFVRCRNDTSPPYRYLMLKFARKNLLIEKLDIFGVLGPE